MSSRSRTKSPSRHNSTMKTPGRSKSISVPRMTMRSKPHHRVDVLTALAHASKLMEKQYPNFATKGKAVLMQFNDRSKTFINFKREAKEGFGYFNFPGALIGAKNYNIAFPIYAINGNIALNIPEFLIANGFEVKDQESHSQFWCFCAILMLCLIGAIRIPYNKKGGSKNRTRRKTGGFAGTFIVLLFVCIVSIGQSNSVGGNNETISKNISVRENNAQICEREWPRSIFPGHFIWMDDQVFRQQQLAKCREARDQYDLAKEANSDARNNNQWKKDQEDLILKMKESKDKFNDGLQIVGLVFGGTTLLVNIYKFFASIIEERKKTKEMVAEKTIKDALKAKNAECSNKINGFVKSLNSLNIEVEKNSAEMENIKDDIKKTDAQIVFYTKSRDEATEKIEEKEEDLANIEEEESKQLVGVDRHSRKKTQLKKKIESLGDAILEYEQSIVDMQKKKLNLQLSLEEKIKFARTIPGQKLKIETDIEEVQTAQELLIRELEVSGKEIEKVVSDIQKINGVIDKSRDTIIHDVNDTYAKVVDYANTSIKNRIDAVKLRFDSDVRFKKENMTLTQADRQLDVDQQKRSNAQTTEFHRTNRVRATAPVSAAAAGLTIAAVETAGFFTGQSGNPALHKGAIEAGLAVGSMVAVSRSDGINGEPDPQAKAESDRTVRFLNQTRDAIKPVLSLQEAAATRKTIARNKNQLALAQKAQQDLSGELYKKENMSRQLHHIKQPTAEQILEMNDLDFALFDTKSRLESAKTDVLNFKKALPPDEIYLSSDYFPTKPSSSDSKLLNQLTHETHELASKTNSLFTETAAASVAAKRPVRSAQNTGAKEKSPTYVVQMSPRERENLMKQAAQMRKDAEAAAKAEAAKAAAAAAAKADAAAKAEAAAPKRTGRKLGQPQDKAQSPAEDGEIVEEIVEEKSRPRGRGE